jgi:hypothetical protein
MELFIRLRDGKPFEHPIFGDNFRAAFPDVDVDSLPAEFARFTRVEPPVIDTYEVYEGVTYEQSGDGYTDVHHVRAMTDDERAVKDQQLAEEHAAAIEWLKNNPMPGTDGAGSNPDVVG